MGSRDHYVLGDYNAICQMCGFKYKASELRKRWDGVMVCKKDYEPRHPQDFIRAIPEQAQLPFTSPEPPDRFLAVGEIIPSML